MLRMPLIMPAAQSTARIGAMMPEIRSITTATGLRLPTGTPSSVTSPKPSMPVTFWTAS